MAALSIRPAFPAYFDASGEPLESGYIYIGTAGLDAAGNAISTFFDAALSVAAAQPIRTINGYPSNSGSPAMIYVAGTDYSMTVSDKNNVTVFSALNITDANYSAASTNTTDIATNVTNIATNVTNIATNVTNIGTNTTKLAGIEAGADVTDATNVDAAGAVMNTDSTTASMSFVIDEDNMASDLDTKVPTQQSTKAYVDSQVSGVGLAEVVASNSSSGTHSGGITTIATTVTISNADDTSTGGEVEVHATKQHSGYTSDIVMTFKRQKGSATWNFVGKILSTEITQGTGKTATFTSDTSTVVLSATSSNLTMTYNFTNGANANTAKICALVKTSA